MVGGGRADLRVDLVAEKFEVYRIKSRARPD